MSLLRKAPQPEPEPEPELEPELEPEPEPTPHPVADVADIHEAISAGYSWVVHNVSAVEAHVTIERPAAEPGLAGGAIRATAVGADETEALARALAGLNTQRRHRGLAE